MSKTIGAELVKDALEARGIKYVFSLSGGHITPIYQFLENSKITIFDTRHEQSAVYMAEAWGRMTRKPGIAIVTAGPGFTNALSAIANANMANSPLVLISGCVGLECVEKLDLQDIRQLPVIEPMVKKAFVCHTPQRIMEFVDLAYRTAMSGRPGPVYLELPVDVLNAEVDRGDGSVKELITDIESRPVDLAGAAKTVDMLSRAKKPVIIAGSGAWYSDASNELKEFIEKTGTPVFTVSGGRGTVPDTHKQCFESSLAIRPGASLFANLNSDMVLMLGNRLSLYYIFGDIFPKTAKFVQVDIKAEEIGRNRSVDLPIVSDIKAFLTECNKIIDGKNLSKSLKDTFAPWLKELKKSEKESKVQQKPNWEKAESPIHPMRLAKEVNDFMNKKDDIVIADGGDTQIWMGMTRTIRQGGHYMDSGLYGCLAVGLPFANAAKLLYPKKRVCLIIGDGSVGFNFMEFETAIRKKLPIVVVISNDLGWGMIRHSQQIRLGHAIDDGTLIGEVPYHKLVNDLGGLGLYVDRADDIAPALEKAFTSGKTACINVMTDPSTISPGSVALANLGGYKA